MTPTTILAMPGKAKVKPVSTYTYRETMKIVEKFMENTGIRELCTSYCKGRCCMSGDCVKPCIYSKRRRLACSSFICYDLYHLLFDQLETNIYLDVHDRIEDELGEAGQDCHDVFFKPYPLKVREAFKIPKRILDTLNRINAGGIASKSYYLKKIISDCLGASKRSNNA